MDSEAATHQTATDPTTKLERRVPVAEFEEREYEMAACLELGESSHVFTSGQVLEHIVGYDAVAQPEVDHRIWQILAVPRPAGVRLTPRNWLPGPLPDSRALPPVAVSLILQYKRPDYLSMGNGKQWKLWHQPYFRFRRTQHQHLVLCQLERDLGVDALVRYAAPAFWRYADLYLAKVHRTVLSQTGFVSPLDLRTHRVWTYVEPGTDGRGNPAGRARRFQTLQQLFDYDVRTLGIGDLAEQGDLMDQAPVPAVRASLDHSAIVADAARHRRPWLRGQVDTYLSAIAASVPGLDEATLEGLRDLASIVTLTDSIDCAWYLLGNR